MGNRETEIQAFLDAAGWGDAARAPIPGDASTRRYEILTQGGQSAVLMDAPLGDEEPSASPEASAEQRRALGYNAVARLAGPHMQAFTGIAQALTRRGFSAPQVYAADCEAGLALLENLGADSYAKVLSATPEKEAELYGAAIDCLAAIYRCVFSDEQFSFDHSWRILGYDDTALLEETQLLTRWYLPEKGGAVSQTLQAELDAAWLESFHHLENLAPGLVLRDFHAENLFWLPQREAVARVGLIDFQDALLGHPAYDLVSLLEDARRDVDPALAEPMIARFCEKAVIRDVDGFRAAYAVLGAQRNAKILGIFVRLARRDKKSSYLDLLPRVEAHFARNLSHPALHKVAAILKDVM